MKNNVNGNKKGLKSKAEEGAIEDYIRSQLMFHHADELFLKVHLLLTR